MPELLNNFLTVTVGVSDEQLVRGEFWRDMEATRRLPTRLQRSMAQGLILYCAAMEAALEFEGRTTPEAEFDRYARNMEDFLTDEARQRGYGV